MATPPLHLAFIRRFISPITRSLHLPDLQQSFLSPIKSSYPLALAHWRETIQMPPPRLRQSLQCPKQHEASRTRLSQLRGRRLAIIRRTIGTSFDFLLMYKIQCPYILHLLRLEWRYWSLIPFHFLRTCLSSEEYIFPSHYIMERRFGCGIIHYNTAVEHLQWR